MLCKFFKVGSGSALRTQLDPDLHWENQPDPDLQKWMRIYIPQLCQIFTYLCLTFKFESFNLWLALPWRRSTSWILSTSAWSRSPPSLTSTGPSSGTTALSTLHSKKLVDFSFYSFFTFDCFGRLFRWSFLLFFYQFCGSGSSKRWKSRFNKNLIYNFSPVNSVLL